MGNVKSGKQCSEMKLRREIQNLRETMCLNDIEFEVLETQNKLAKTTEDDFEKNDNWKWYRGRKPQAVTPK